MSQVTQVAEKIMAQQGQNKDRRLCVGEGWHKARCASIDGHRTGVEGGLEDPWDWRRGRVVVFR